MGDIKYLVDLFGLSGALWTIAVAGAFVAGIGEKSYPNEGGKHPAPVALLAGIASLITPFLLFLHAFWAIAPHTPGETADIMGIVVSTVGSGAAWALFGVMALLIVLPSLVGTLTAAVTPPLGKLLYWIAPYLNIAVLALAVYATHDNVLAVISAVMHGPTAV